MASLTVGTKVNVRGVGMCAVICVWEDRRSTQAPSVRRYIMQSETTGKLLHNVRLDKR